jgi:hypothetical protein
MDPVKSMLKKLKPFIGRKADRIWVRYTTAGAIERSKWEQIINLLAEKHKVNTIDDDIVLPPPDPETAVGDIDIGSMRYAGRRPHPFGIKLHELTRHTGIFGSTGTGKTTVAKNILRQLIDREIPFIVFDWERNYRDLIGEGKKVKVFTIGSDVCPFYFNFFKMPGNITYKDYVKYIIEVFSKAYVGGAGSDSVLLKVFDAAYRQHELPTVADARGILDDDMHAGVLRGREMLWKQSSLRMLEFLCYGGTGDIFNAENLFPMESLLNEQVVFELGALANSNDKRFFIEMFTLWYWLYKEHLGAEDERLKHVIVFEEFHNIVENSKKEDLVQKIFRQIRKYGTALIIIDQTPALIPNPVFENIYTKITFSLNHRQNVKAIADAMYMETEESRYIGLLKTGQAICRLMGRYPHPFLIDIPFVKPGQNITDERVREHMQDFYNLYSPERPGKAQTAPLRIPPEPFTPSPLERIFLEDLALRPFDGVDRRTKRLGLIPREATQIQNALIANNLVTPVTVDRRKLFELTEKGNGYLSDHGINTASGKNQGIAHRYYIDRMARLFEKSGWSVEKEKDDIDLVVESNGRVVAVEVETGLNNRRQIQKNIEKLIGFEAAFKLIVTTTEEAFSRIQALLEETNPPNPIRVIPAKQFLKHPPV